MREPFRLPIYVEPRIALVPPPEPDSEFDPEPVPERISVHVPILSEPEPTYFAWLIDAGYPDWIERPQTRAECLKEQHAQRPCPWITCKYHLYVDVSHRGKLDIDVTRMSHSCVLDIADNGGITLEEIGDLMGVTRERIRQLEAVALKKSKKARQGVLKTFLDE